MTSLPLSPVRLLCCRSGATALEYALLLALIAIAVMGVVRILGSTIEGHYDTAAKAMPSNIESQRGEEHD